MCHAHIYDPGGIFKNWKEQNTTNSLIIDAIGHRCIQSTRWWNLMLHTITSVHICFHQAEPSKVCQASCPAEKPGISEIDPTVAAKPLTSFWWYSSILSFIDACLWLTYIPKGSPPPPLNVLGQWAWGIVGYTQGWILQHPTKLQIMSLSYKQNFFLNFLKFLHPKVVNYHDCW